jgi:hypothetical protein
MPTESDDPEVAFNAQYSASLFAQVVWKETTKVWVCRLMSAQGMQMLFVHRYGNALGQQTPQTCS